MRLSLAPWNATSESPPASVLSATEDLGDLSPGRADLAIYRENSGRSGTYLGSSHRFCSCPTSDGLETA